MRKVTQQERFIASYLHQIATEIEKGLVKPLEIKVSSNINLTSIVLNLDTSIETLLGEKNAKS